MLFDSLSSIKQYMPFGAGVRFFWGKVIDNEDPRLLGRIKVQIIGLLPWDDKEKLPWIYPLYPAGLGEAPLTTFFSVPEVESYVVCIFPFRSIYSGFYSWHTLDRKRRLSDFDSDYPERYGWSDSRENKFIVNKDPDIDTIEHRYADGGVSVYDSKNHIFTFKDEFGNSIFVDRESKILVIDICGIRFQIDNGRFKIKGSSIELLTSTLRLVGSSFLSLAGNIVSSVSSVFGSSSNKSHTSDNVNFEYLDRE